MNNLSIALLIILTFLGALYAFSLRQVKIALGLFVIACAFALNIPGIVSGFWQDLLLGLSLIVYSAGIFIIVQMKKKIESKEENEKDDK